VNLLPQLNNLQDPTMTSQTLSYKEGIAETLDAILLQTDNPLTEMMRYALCGGGKRIRPRLTLYVAELFGAPIETACTPACAIEIVHTYSLIHDDLPCMDDDDFRRGLPTLHKKFGEAEAVLTGDLLLTLAFELLATAPGLTDRQRTQLVQVLAQGSGGEGMVGGQLLDIQAKGKPHDLAELQTIHQKKTGALITAAVLAGGIVGHASKEQLALLQQFGQKIGLAFQITDDLLDKEEEDNATYLHLMGEEATSLAADALLKEAVTHLSELPGDSSSLVKFAHQLVHRTV
jgi:geranylgeranyl diphosphate synthase type II